MSRRVSCEALRRPPQPQEILPPASARNGLMNFQAAQNPQTTATPTATALCQSILTTPSQSHRALIRHQRRNVGQ